MKNNGKWIIDNEAGTGERLISNKNVMLKCENAIIFNRREPQSFMQRAAEECLMKNRITYKGKI